MQEQDTLIKQLLEAGVHFGHQTNRWNPKMAKYIFGEKNGIYIIDLQKTIEGINKATSFLREIAAGGEYVLFVGTKKQAQHLTVEHAQRCRMFYVSERWLGGTLTNFSTIRKSIKRLEEIEKMRQDGTFEVLSKKERAQLTKELEKLMKNLGGIRKMIKLPAAVFIIDSKDEEIAIKEANKLSIPVVAIVDTNCDPDRVNYIIPGNDDAMRSIELLTRLVADSVLEGRQEFIKGTPGVEDESDAEAEIKVDEEEIEELVTEKAKDEIKEERIKKKPTHRPVKRRPTKGKKT